MTRYRPFHLLNIGLLVPPRIQIFPLESEWSGAFGLIWLPGWTTISNPDSSILDISLDFFFHVVSLFNICLPGTCSTIRLIVKVPSKIALLTATRFEWSFVWPMIFDTNPRIFALDRPMQCLLCKIVDHCHRYFELSLSSHILPSLVFHFFAFPRFLCDFVNLPLSGTCSTTCRNCKGTFQDHPNNDDIICVVVNRVCDLL